MLTIGDTRGFFSGMTGTRKSNEPAVAPAAAKPDAARPDAVEAVPAKPAPAKPAPATVAEIGGREGPAPTR